MPVTDLGAARGFTWGPEDVLITTPPSYLGLVRIHAMGGETEEITIPGESEWHFAPILLPEGDAVLFTILNLADLSYRVAIVDLATGEQSEVGLTGFASDLTSSNHLLVTRKAVLWAAAFDPTRREVTGDAVPVLSDVDVGGVDVANDGTLVYRRGSSTEQLAWVDRDGREEHLALAPASYAHARVSPDGQQLAVIIQDPQTGRDLWIYTFDRDVLTRLTFDATTESMPEWHGDGRRLVFGAVKTGMGVGLYTKANDGTGPAELLMRDDDFWYFPTAWASDDNTILFDRCTQGLIDCNIWVLDKGDTASARPLWESQFNVRGGTLSPDGKWLAYQSDESGQMHVYVRPFPNVESKQRQVSRDGGQQPVWGSNGDEIFYLGPTHMMAAPFDTLSGLNVGLPRPLFTLSNYVYKSGRNYSVSPGRNRFLMVKKLESDEAVGSTLVLNWLSELDRLVPTKSK